MGWTGQGEPLRAVEWEVRPVDIAVAERLVTRFHYAAGASNTAVALHGLFPAGSLWEQECRGVAWWLPPTKVAAAALAGPDWEGVLALSRLAIEPGMPGNSATFLMAASLRMLDRRRWPVLVTYADGWRGHSGAIYRATGWTEHGETAPEEVWTLNGRMIARKAGPRSRTREEMIALGAVSHGKHRRIRFVKR